MPRQIVSEFRNHYKRFLIFIVFLLVMTGCSVSASTSVPSSTSAVVHSETLALLPENHAAENFQDLDIHFLDVGQGLSVLVSSGGQTLLYDGGGREYSRFVVSYLKDQEIETLDYIIASHYDEDHINGLVGVLNTFPVNTVIGPDYVHTSRVYESFIRSVQEQGREVSHLPVDTEFSLGAAKITILSPKNIVKHPNNNSVAVKIENGQHTILIMGDAEHALEADILSSGIDLDCTILVLGHHGSASSTSWDLLQKAVPEYAIISCGENNSYGHPHEETMEKLQSMEIDFFRTDKQGTITVNSDGQSLTWNIEPSTDYSNGRQTSQPDSRPSATSEALPAIQTEATPAAGTAGLTSEISTSVSQMVWKSATGSKYHAIPNCGNMNPDKASEITLDNAQSLGLDKCKNCWR